MSMHAFYRVMAIKLSRFPKTTHAASGEPVDSQQVMVNLVAFYVVVAKKRMPRFNSAMKRKKADTKHRLRYHGAYRDIHRDSGTKNPHMERKFHYGQRYDRQRRLLLCSKYKY